MSSDLGIEAMIERLRATYEARLAESGLTPEQHEAAILAAEDRARIESAHQAESEARRSVVERFGNRLSDRARQALLDGSLLPTPALDAVSRWLAARQRPVLVLTGGVGAGKTLAALWALTRVPGDLVPARELARRHDPWGEDRQAGVKPLDLRHRLLVLDDLGTEREDARFMPALEDVLDSRQSGVRTLITTNIKPKDIRARYGDRFADRLREVATSVQVETQSMRGGGHAGQ